MLAKQKAYIYIYIYKTEGMKLTEINLLVFQNKLKTTPVADAYTDGSFYPLNFCQ